MNSRKSRPKGERAADTLTLSVRVQPRASKNEIIPAANGAFKIRLTAPPVDNAANEALVRFLSGVFTVSRSRIEILSGHTSRDKIIRIHGLTEADAKTMLNAKAE